MVGKHLQNLLVQDFDERKALQLAIDQEEALEKSLREMAAKIDDPEIARVYLANATSTHNHLELRSEEHTPELQSREANSYAVVC